MFNSEIERLQVENEELKKQVEGVTTVCELGDEELAERAREISLLKAEIVKKNEALMRVSTYGCSSCDDAIEKSGLNQHQHNAQCFIHNAISPTITSDLVQDKERLDWRENHLNDCRLRYAFKEQPTPLWVCCVDGKEYTGKTLRLAIDSARKEEKK